MQLKNEKPHKCKDRKLDLVGKAKLVKLGQIGYVERKGRSRLIRGQGNVEIFFPEKEDKRAVRYSKRIFKAQFAEFVG